MTEEPMTTGSAPQPVEPVVPSSEGADEHPEDNQHPALDPDLASPAADDAPHADDTEVADGVGDGPDAGPTRP